MSRYVGIVVSFLLGLYAWAQKPYVELIVQPTDVEVDQMFNVVVKTNISGEMNIEYPDGYEQGFDVMNSMEKGFDENTGKVVSFYYHACSGSMKKEGKFNFGPVHVRRGNKVYKSNQVAISVAGKNENNNEVVERILFRKPACGVVHVSKEKVYVGEAVVVESKIYSRFKPSTYGNYKSYSFSQGVDQYKVPGPEEPIVRNESRHNANCFAFEKDKQVVFFNSPGKTIIEPFEITLQSGFDEYRFASKQREIHVIPLPKGAPSSFSGGVGNFDIKSSLNRNNFKKGDIVTLTLELSGDGNLQSLSNPKINFPKGLSIYGDPERKEDFSFSNKGGEGQISIQYHLRILEKGEIELPEVVFSYFDPKQKKYVTKRTSSEILQVEDNPSLVVAGDATLAENSTRMERFDNKNVSNRTIFSNPFVKWLGISTPLCLAFLFLFFRLKKKREETVIADKPAENKVEKVRPNEWLSVLQPYVATENTLPFFTQLSKSLQSAVSQAARGDVNWVLSRNEIKVFFEQKKFSADFQNRFFDLQQTCELFRYGCQTPKESLTDYFNQAKIIFEQLDQVAT